MERAITFRPARDEDASFLSTVYASTRAEELALLDWDEQQRAAFLTMQFTAQQRYYRTVYADATCRIILADGVPVGQTAQLTATGTFTDSSTQDLTSQATWSSDKPDVASVDASGKVTAKAAGTATITASGGGKQGTITVTVSAPVFTGVQPNPAPAARPGGASAPTVPGGTPAATPAPLPTGR